MSTKPKILIFASGTKTGGGSGFVSLIEASRTGILNAEIVGVVSNHQHGGVRKNAEKLDVPFYYMSNFYSSSYQKLAMQSEAHLFVLSGWLRHVQGLGNATRFNSRSVINIHPGPLPRFGGPGMYGKHVHEAVLNAFRHKEITNSAITVHFVTEEFDEGPVIMSESVPIFLNDTAHTLEARVKEYEHYFYTKAINLILEKGGW